jgi:hypothetical protein
MFDIDTGSNSNGGSEGPFVAWASRESLDGEIPGRTFSIRDADGKRVFSAFEKLNLFNAGWDNLMAFSNSYGLKVFIENNTHISDGNKNSISLNGGTINYLSTQRSFSSSLPKPYSDCDIDNTNSNNFDSTDYNLILNSPYQYSQDLCVIQCMQQYVIETCNCSIPIY